MAYNKELLKDKYSSLSLKNCFGMRTDINDNVSYFCSDKCAYISGNFIVISTIKEKTQYFIPANPNYGEITCFSIDEKGDIILLAFAQKGEKNIITLKFMNKNDIGNENGIREVKLSPDDLEYGDYFISISVNLTKFYIAAFFGTKVSGIVLYYYDPKNTQTKIIAGERLTSKYNYKQIKINPYDPNYFAVIGEGAFAVFKYNENDKKLNRAEVTQVSYPEFEKCVFNFVTFTWVNQTRMAIINYSCDIFIIDYIKKFDTPIKKVIRSTELFDTKSRAKSIFSKFNNIYLVKDDGYTLKLESKNIESKQISYDKINGPKFIQNLPRMEVHTVSVNNPSNAVGNYAGVLISSESGQLFHIEISNDSSLFEGSNFKHFISPFHSEEIVSLDCAKNKPLVATASKDRYIRIWNYVSIQLESSETFEEEPTHIAFHPNGLHLATLFRSKCKLMNICEKKIRVYKEINIDQPFDVKFSTYGHYFSICYSSKFIIYDFYSMDIRFKTVENSHKGEVTSLVWDSGTGISDFYFATCGMDGKAYYWDISNPEHALFEYINKDKKFFGVNYYKVVDTSNNNLERFYFILIDENSLFEVEGFPIIKEGGKIIHSKEIEGKRDLKPAKVLLKEEYINQFFFDVETKIIVSSNSREHSPTVRLFRQFSLDPKEMLPHQANSTGVKQFKVSHDMSYLFTCGRDKCLLIFQINNVSKQDKREESTETDLILVEKAELDQEKDNLANKLTLIQNDIIREEERAIKEQRELDSEIQNNNTFLRIKEQDYFEEKSKLETEIAQKEEEYNMEEQEKLEVHDDRITQLRNEQENNKQIKENEEKKENENIDKTIKNHNNQEINQLKLYKTEKKRLDQEYEDQIISININIKERENQKEKLNRELTDEKEKLMSDNDNNIARKRYELEKLRIEYDRVEREFSRHKNEMNNDILKKKKEVKNKEETKNTERNDLQEMQNTNDKIAKEIRELSAEKKDKDQTIKEKSAIERDLFKENQELEKFKFVLNYKIKELQHEKDPKENKLQQLEKQAKDMDREIKNFEFAQRNYLIELTTNNEIMNLHEKQIIECERGIERLKHYKKLFKQALFQASLKAGSYKHLKRRIVELKKWFLDKDYIEQLEKTSDDSDYETQREFLEENNKNNKEKIRSTQKLFGQDNQKLMRENMNLIKIVNELEREQCEIKQKNFNHEDKEVSLRGKAKSKLSVPVFSQGSSSLSQKEKDLNKELMETEKEIVMLNLKKKKMKREREELEKMERKRDLKSKFV